MTSKFDYYDLLGILVPGVLLISWLPVCFPDAGWTGAEVFPEAFGVIALTALSVFLGQLVQAIGSMLEPALFKTWGGRPSDIALGGGLPKYLPADSAERIKKKLSTAAGGNGSNHALFLLAMQRADGQNSGRAQRFNSLYAYHRGLLVLIIVSFALLMASFICGAGKAWSIGSKLGIVLLFIGLLVLVWHRTRQRACYYVREVLHCAERGIDERQSTKE